MAPDAAAPATDPAAPPATENQGTLKVQVPEDSLVYVNGILTRSTGSARTYVSRGLSRGFHYTYEVRAEAVRDGVKVEETKVVSLKPGDSVELAFTGLQPANSVDTTLTLNVPADAKVTLGGNETNGAGAERTFKTSKLSRGSEWSDYLVQVSVEREGRMVTQEKSITLKAGDNRTLTFDFDSAQVASAR